MEGEKEVFEFTGKMQMHSRSNGPLHHIVSRMGKSKHERARADRIFLHSHTHQPLRAKRKGWFPESAAKKKKYHHDDRLESMELLRGVYALAQTNHLTIDAPVLRLHSNTTVILLVTFSIAVTTRQYVGNPIDCIHTRDIPEDVLNTFCWIHSTFTIVNDGKNVQGHIPGVQTAGNEPTRQIKYYQWVAFFLFFQSKFAGFYIISNVKLNKVIPWPVDFIYLFIF